jgi:hypothetical protein
MKGDSLNFMNNKHLSLAEAAGFAEKNTKQLEWWNDGILENQLFYHQFIITFLFLPVYTL